MDLRERLNTRKKRGSTPKSVVTRVTPVADTRKDNDQDLRGVKAKKARKKVRYKKRSESPGRRMARGEAALQGEVALRSRKRRRTRRSDEDDDGETDVTERKVRYVEEEEDLKQPEEAASAQNLRAPSPASSSSLSLSPSPSPERRPSPPPPPPPPSRGYRSRSPSSGRSRHSSGRRSPPRPPVRRHSYYDEPKYDGGGGWDGRDRPRRSSYEDGRPPPPPQQRHSHFPASVTSWESKVEAFMQELQKRTPTPPQDGGDVDAAGVANGEAEDKKETVPASAGSKDPKPPGEEDDEDEDAQNPEEDIKVTPLVRFVGKKLSDAGDGDQKKRKRKGTIALRLEGVFQYSLVSLFSRAEWVAAKSIKLLEDAGFPETKMSIMATMRGGLVLETDLKSAVFTGKVKLGNRPELVHQVLKVIEYIVKYFTAKDGDADSSDEEEEEESEVEQRAANAQGGNALRRGMGEILKQLAVEEDAKALRERRAAEEAAAALPKQPPINHWSLIEDTIQAENLKSLDGVKTHVAKSMLRLGDEKLCEASRAFEVAQDMVSCLVVAGYNHASLVQRVMQTPADAILPPKDEQPVGATAAPDRKPVLFDEVLQKLHHARPQLPPDITEHQLQFVARKSLVYVMRGCEKAPSAAAAGGPLQQLPPHRAADGSNIVFNYLPPGLREMEARKAGVARNANGQLEVDGTMDDSEKYGDAPVPAEELDPEVKESKDPLNAILNPEMHERDQNLLPAKKKYMFGTFHAEWVVMQGRPQVYSVSVYMSDHSSLDVYFIPEALKRNSELFSSLGFVANPDRNEYYFVQVGLGVIKALGVERGVDKLAHFLEEKRETSSSSENRNNGLVLACYAEEEVAILARMLEEGGHKNVLLDSVKGLACLEHYFDRNRSKKLAYSGPKLNVGSDEAFYETEVRKGLSTSNLVSKNKAEALFRATEYVLESLPSYRNFIRPYAFRAFGSPKVDLAKKRLKQAEEMYPLEVFMAAQLKQQKIPLFAEGVFAPQLGKDVRDKCTVVASRMCRLLIEAGFDKATLAKCFENREFTINSSVILDKMAMAQRLKVMDQTMRCIGILKSYFLVSK